MGVDTKIYLPANVCVRDVADVIAILAGKKAERRDFSTGNSGWSTEVDGVKVKNSSVETCLDIFIEGPFSEAAEAVRGGQESIHVLYHMEGSKNGERLLMPRSTPFWKAIGKGLVKFFGGRVDYSDHDDSYCDFYRKPKSAEENHPSNGEPWYNLQIRKLKLKPLTEKNFIEFGSLEQRIAAMNRGAVKSK